MSGIQQVMMSGGIGGPYGFIYAGTHISAQAGTDPGTGLPLVADVKSGSWLVNNFVLTSDGKFDSVVAYNGDGEVGTIVSKSGIASFSPMNPFSAEGWFENGEAVCSIAVGSGYPSIVADFTQSNSPQGISATIVRSVSEGVFTYVSTGLISDPPGYLRSGGAFNHFVLSFDGATLRAAVCGKIVASLACAPLNATPSVQFSTGGSVGSGPKKIDELLLCSRPRTADFVPPIVPFE